MTNSNLNRVVTTYNVSWRQVRQMFPTIDLEFDDGDYYSGGDDERDWEAQDRGD